MFWNLSLIRFSFFAYMSFSHHSFPKPTSIIVADTKGCWWKCRFSRKQKSNRGISWDFNQISQKFGQSEHDLRNAWQQCRLWNVSNKCKFIRELKSYFSDIMWYLCGRLQWDYRLEVEAPSSDSSPDSEGVTPVRHLLSYSFASANKIRSFISLVHFPEDTTV